MVNIKQNIKKGNFHTWERLTLGKLLCIGRLAKLNSANDPIANDLYHEVLNYLFDNYPADFEYLRKL